MSEQAVLRQAMLKGGGYLIGRQGISILLKLVGVILITRVLGPARYGAYVSASNIYTYALAIGSAGVGVYLLRSDGVVSELAYGTAYTVLSAMALAVVLLAEALAGPLGHWIGIAEFEPAFRVIMLAIPFQLLAIPASVRLERQLDYRRVAMLELSGQISFYVLAVPLVMAGGGPTALAAAWVVQQAVGSIIAHVAARSYPRFAFDPTVGRLTLHYAATFSFANWIWQLRTLVNPMIVGPVLGARAVGILGITIGVLEMLTVIKTIAWRISVAVLTKVTANTARLRTAVTEGMELQVLAVGALLLGFSWLGHFIVPRFFGPRWAGVMDVYPYIALSYLTISTFNIHSACLSVLNRNRDVGVYNTVSLLLFIPVTWIGVRHFGIYGYCFGEVATLPAYVVMHHMIARAIGSPNYRLAALWWVGSAIGLFWWQLGSWAIAVPFLALLPPLSSRRLMLHYRALTKRG